MRFVTILLAIWLLTALDAQAQQATRPLTLQTFTFVEQPPSFPGGEAKMMAFLSEHIHYPETARQAGITGKVLIKFVIDSDGSVTDITVLRGIGGGCDSEAVRVVKAMPRWNPGRQEGKPVRVYFTLPITFRLEDNDELPAGIFTNGTEKQLFNEGMNAASQKDLPLASRKFRQAAAINPGNPLTQIWLGLIARDSGRLTAYEQYLRQAYTNSKVSETVYKISGETAAQYLAEACILNRDYDKALELVKEQRKSTKTAFWTELAASVSTLQQAAGNTDKQLQKIVANLEDSKDHCAEIAELGMRYEQKHELAAAFLLYSLHNFVNPKGEYSMAGNQVVDYRLTQLITVKHHQQVPLYALSALDPLVDGMMTDTSAEQKQTLANLQQFARDYNRIAVTGQNDFVVHLFAGLMQRVAEKQSYKWYLAAILGSLSGKKEILLAPSFKALLNDWYTSYKAE